MSDFKFLDNLTSAFALLPGVGEKTATRYAYSVVEKMSDEDVDNFVKALKEVKTNIKHCSTCGMLTLTDPCTICSSSRDKSKIMVLKDTRDVLAIEKMGDAQFVFWDYMTEEFVDEIVDSENISKTLREQMLRDRFSKVNRTIDKTLSSPAMQKHKRLYSQSAEAFRDGNSDLAVTGFTSVFDGLLTDISGNPTSRLGPRIDVIKKKLDNDEFLDNDEYAMLTLALTLEKTLDSFSAPSDFKGKEPTGLNRHWIAHGRSTRKKSKIDCVKMINLIYGLLLIVDLESTVSPNFSCINGV